MLALTTCCQPFKRLNCFSQHVFKPLLLGRLRTFTSPGTVNYIHSNFIPPSAEKRLRRKYSTPDGYKMIYSESTSQIYSMLFVKSSQLLLYTSPLLIAITAYSKGYTLVEAISQTDLWIGAAILSMYIAALHYATKTYVEAIFYNGDTGMYRIYLLKNFSIGMRYIDFTRDDLRSAKINPKIPYARNVFKLGKEFIVLHDSLFVNRQQQHHLLLKASEDAEEEK